MYNKQQTRKLYQSRKVFAKTHLFFEMVYNTKKNQLLPAVRDGSSADIQQQNEQEVNQDDALAHDPTTSTPPTSHLDKLEQLVHKFELQVNRIKKNETTVEHDVFILQQQTQVAVENNILLQQCINQLQRILNQQADILQIGLDRQKQLINNNKQNLQAESQQTNSPAIQNDGSENSSETERNVDLQQEQDEENGQYQAEEELNIYKPLNPESASSWEDSISSVDPDNHQAVRKKLKIY